MKVYLKSESIGTVSKGELKTISIGSRYVSCEKEDKNAEVFISEDVFNEKIKQLEEESANLRERLVIQKRQKHAIIDAANEIFSKCLFAKKNHQKFLVFVDIILGAKTHD